MGKIVLLGDTHLDIGKSSPIFHSYISKSFEFMFDYMNENNIKKIIQLGDLFDNKKYIHFNTLYESNKYFFSKLDSNKITMYCFTGNHDALYKNTNRVSSVSLLKTDNMVVVGTVPQTINIDSVDFDFYPWINTENYDKSIELIKSSTSKYAVGHFEFKNFPLHRGTIAESGMDHKMFSSYEKVFSGHYHTISQEDNILYTGTPYELDWSDCGDNKGFWVLDTVSGDLEFIKNPHTIFTKIMYVEDMEFDFSSVKDKFVKLFVIDKKSQKKFDSFIDSININSPHDLKISEQSVVESVSNAVSMNDTVVSTKSMITNVLDNIDTQLDKSMLKNKVYELYHEAQQISNSF